MVEIMGSKHATETASGNVEHLKAVVVPAIEAALERGERKYTGKSHWQHQMHIERANEEDIRHVTRCHVEVRLREAEDAATVDDPETALSKVESAMGYLLVLHRRMSMRGRAG